MREAILNALENAKELYQILDENYRESLPIVADIDSVIERIIYKTNEFLKCLNYSEITDLDDAIGVFEDLNTQNSIDELIENKDLVVLINRTGSEMTMKETLEILASHISLNVETLNSYISIAKLNTSN